ncbi:MAG: RIP metalloprotease [Hyphomonadaceae bacterium]|nr:RIP metalloprotease [Hyphomonadaceae bacterium]
MLEGLQGVLLSLGAFVLVLSVVVFVHEFGHFQAARWGKVAIDTFSIGFGKTLLSWRDRQGVVWRVAALPLGGYVKFTGDADAVSSHPEQASDDPAAMAEARRKGLFHAMPLSTRAFVVAAGPFTNFIFSTIAFAALIMIVGRDVTPVASLSPRIDGIEAQGPAALGGLQAGDIVTAIDGRPVASFGAMQDIVRANPGETLAFTVQRDGAIAAAQVTVGARDVIDRTGVEQETGYLGVSRQTQPEERQIERLGPLAALGDGAGQVWGIIASTGAYIGNVFSGKASAEHIAGPAGIFDASGKVAQSAIAGDDAAGDKLGRLALSLLAWAATLSVAVGLVNLMPVPMLDGGHLVFYGIEAARGRPLGPKAQEIGYRAGFAVVASLFLFATWNDLQRSNLLEFLGGMLS